MNAMLFDSYRFSERLKELRSSSGLTVYQLSKDTGIPASCICNYENCNNEPSLSAAIKFALYFKCPLDFLAGIKSDKELSPTAFECGEKIDSMKRFEQDLILLVIDAIKEKVERLRKNERSHFSQEFLKGIDLS